MVLNGFERWVIQNIPKHRNMFCYFYGCYAWLLNACQCEQVKRQQDELRGQQPVAVDAVSRSRPPHPGRKPNPQPKHGTGNQCKWCGREPHARRLCPAKEASCNFCHTVGHYETVCLKKKRTCMKWQCLPTMKNFSPYRRPQVTSSGASLHWMFSTVLSLQRLALAVPKCASRWTQEPTSLPYQLACSRHAYRPIDTQQIWKCMSSMISICPC